MTDNLDLDKLAELEKAATPGPWAVWEEPCLDRDAAIEELSTQVESTNPFAGRLYLLEANGKCPCTTGCGTSSEANAAFIAALRNDASTLIEMARRVNNRMTEESHAAAIAEFNEKAALKEVDRLNAALAAAQARIAELEARSQRQIKENDRLTAKIQEGWSSRDRRIRELEKEISDLILTKPAFPRRWPG